MANDSITFFCPACNIRLTVPGSLAGVTGPCPSCRALIQAPYPAPVVSAPVQSIAPAPSVPLQTVSPAPQVEYPSQHPGYQPPQPVYTQPAQPIYAQPTQPDYPPQQPVYPPPQPVSSPAAVPIIQPPIQPEHYTDYAALPVANPVPVSLPVSPSPQSPATLRPEPRQLPNRSSPGESIAKQVPEAKLNCESSKSPATLPPPPRQRSKILLVLVPLLFLTLTIALILGIWIVLKNQGKDSHGNKGKLTESTVLSILPENNPAPKTPDVSKEESTLPLPVPTPELPSIIEPVPVLPEGIEPETPGKSANDVLEKFLAAKSLSERLPMIETKSPDSELAKSCLAAPLPASSNLLIEAQESNAVEQVTDVYYNVDFATGNNMTNNQTILVRTRGSGEPKIVVDPFLDSFGGRLAAYARTPSDKSGTFQVIISAVASCNDERVPNREKKLTLKLLPRDNTKEIARAYFGRQSKIGTMLEDGTYSLSYGKAKACTVVLRWNTEDNPQAPYLEAMDLKTLDWNP
ncbi:MAG: hypothetical protein ABI600_04195 [Luteolibacter sp.]